MRSQPVHGGEWEEEAGGQQEPGGPPHAENVVLRKPQDLPRVRKTEGLSWQRRGWLP